MTITSSLKEIKTPFLTKKKRINWNQSLTVGSQSHSIKKLDLKKSLYFILLLKKFNTLIDFKNLKLLKGFLTKSGKIRPGRKTRILPIQQRKIAKAIKKARALGLIPFTCNVRI